MRHWPRSRTLAARLASVAAVAVVIAVGLVVVVAYLLVRTELRGTVDDDLRRQADRLHSEIVAENRLDDDDLPTLANQPGETRGLAQLIDTGGHTTRPDDEHQPLPVTAGDLAVAAGNRALLLRDVWLDNQHLRVLTMPSGRAGHAVQLAVPLATVDDQLRRLAAAFAGVAVAGLLLAVLLARLVAARAVAPVRRLTEAAELVATTLDLGHRIGDDARRDELGRLAASFNTMLDALQVSVSAQRQLVADASHELRTPIASLRTNVEVLRRVDELTPAAREEVVDAVVEQLGELTALVGDVVELARGEQPPITLEEVRLDRMVEHAVDRARRHWPAVTFGLRAAPVVVLAAPARLDRAVANLLDNAAKFCVDALEPRVQVALDETGRLTVTDSGPGVPEEDLPHVFERFYRATAARAMPGSGLGLAIVAQVAATHRGQVRLRNRPEGGAEAELLLPPLEVPQVPFR